jgi:hypothetical protein
MQGFSVTNHGRVLCVVLLWLQAKLLATEVSELERTVSTLSAKCEEMEAADKERFAVEEDRHQAEVTKLKVMNEQLKETLETLLAPPSSSKK